MNEEISELLTRILDFNYYGWLTKQETIVLSSYIKNLQHRSEEKDKVIEEKINVY